MLIEFFLKLKQAGVPVSIKEFLTLMDALKHGIAYGSVDDFYYLGRLTLVKDETHFDKYDRAFAEYFKGVMTAPDDHAAAIPEEWLSKLVEQYLTDEEKAQIEALGGLDKVLELLRQRLAEHGRHQGGNKWIGTAGTSPFGAYGFNRRYALARKALAIDARSGCGTSVNIATTTIPLNRCAQHQSGAESWAFRARRRAEELDLSGTIHATANNAGYLDLKLVPNCITK